MDNLAFAVVNGKPVTASDVFVAQHVPVPTPQPHDLLVRVEGISVNPIDTKRRLLVNTANGPQILGYDAVGTIEQLGAAVTGFTRGQRVIYAGTTRRPGSDQQWQLVDARLAAPVAHALPLAELAGLPLVGLTAWELLFEQFGFTAAAAANRGKRLLIINGAGGVGTMMAQLAHWAGLTVAATASPNHHTWLKAHHVTLPLDYHQDLVAAMRQADWPLVDAVALLYDPIPYLAPATALVAPGGHIGSLVTPAKPLDMAPLKAKSLRFDQEYMFTKTDFAYHIASQGAILARLATLLQAGVLQNAVSTRLEPISRANLIQATKLVEGGHQAGKVVLTGPFTA